MLEVKNINFSYESKVIFKDISFKINPGEILFIKGDNGSGKTTLLKNLTGELKPSSGEVLGQKEFFSLPSEHNGLFLDLPAYHQLKFWAQLYLAEDKKIIQALDYWDLTESYLIREIAVKKYSTGMKRKLALARAHLCPAEVFILDEPCNGLDEKSCEKFRLWVAKKTQEDKALFIIVSHDKNLLTGLDFKVLQVGKN